jgi:hypothetical protein
MLPCAQYLFTLKIRMMGNYMKLLHFIAIALCVSASMATAETPATANPRLAPIEKLSLALNRLQVNVEIMKRAVESGDDAKICTSMSLIVGDMTTLRDLQIENMAIDPEGAKSQGAAQKLEKMNAQIVEAETDFKATCG